ncbi:Helix-turn-helix domain-containing protein [Paenibacillus algorifonticola]|uniref:Helix-turn-helix domain-containing protein n=1 Tax=Paenibacillus algorifonticola TaxID=684063 RepID=A0A1I2GID4_9BACL|nr:AraC family transcriptional regulator [Paenibacillus algorifonticola]SFF16983.1 Helix-turn-helix domain-containing protein [Paenibacillus algorifonticola]
MAGEKQLQVRFFMSLALISICSVLVLATVLFFWFREKTIDNVNKANVAVLLNTETVFMKYMDMVQNYTMDFYHNPNIYTVMQSGDNSWSDQLYSALSQIRGTLTINDFLENAYILGPGGPVMMFENNPLSGAAKQELFERVRDSEIRQSPFVWSATLNNGQSETMMTTFYNDRAFKSSEFNGAIAMTINLRKLQENLFNKNNEGDTRYAVLNADHIVLMQSSSSDQAFDSRLLQQIVSVESKAGTLVWKTGAGDKKLITYHQSQNGGLWFISETSYKNSVRDIASARNIMVGLCLALIAAASAAAAFVSYRMYKPIGTLFGTIRNLSDDRLAFPRGGGFDEANRELERIGDRVKELKQENEDSALLRWLTSPYRADEHVPSALPPMSQTHDNGAFCVAVLHVGLSSGDNSLAATNWREHIRSFPELTEQLFAGTGTCRGFFPHHETAVLIVSETANGSFGDYGTFRERWEQLSYSIREWEGGTCSVGVSSLSADPLQLKQMYDEASSSLQYIKLHEHLSLSFADDIIHLNSSSVPDSTLEFVLQAVRSQDRELLPKAVERLLAVACSYKVEQATVALSKLASDLQKIAETGLAESMARHTDFLDHYQHIWRTRSYAELRAWLEKLCFDAYGKLNDLNTVQTRNLASEAIAYIRNHFGDQTLSLNGLAEKLTISPPYLSRLITEATGSSFPDFVNLVRLEHARSLLIAELELDIREIAEKSGYNSSTYFTTLFKKRYGVTPSKWRLNYILQKEN